MGHSPAGAGSIVQIAFERLGHRGLVFIVLGAGYLKVARTAAIMPRRLAIPVFCRRAARMVRICRLLPCATHYFIAMISGLFRKVFGSRNDRLIKQYAQAVKRVNAF